MMLSSAFARPERTRVYVRRLIDEAYSLGVSSLGIVAVVSLFMGAVITLNTAYQLVSPLISPSVIGSVVSDSTILELAPTICSLVLAGKVGSNIATELGSMRVSEQIDALDVMGVNSIGFLIWPKIMGFIITLPVLIVISMFLSLLGGYTIGNATGIVSGAAFIEGAQSVFRTYTFVFAMIKTFTFAFIISSVSSYQGYYVDGGSIDVGKSATRSVVFSCVLILISDYTLAQLLLLN